MKILFVCTQNVFRSFSAHKLLEKYFNDNKIEEFIIDSCGTHAYDWEKPYSYTNNKLESLGIENVYNHKNKKINNDLANNYDIIISMTKTHKNYIKNNFGIDSYLFNELAIDKSTDLMDDTETNYDDLEEFVKGTISYINKNTPNIAKKIIKLNKSK